MDIIILKSSKEPMYAQIVKQIQINILKGKLKPGDMLPSIRQLAQDLRVSVITTQRAHDELERTGYISSVVGKGSFINDEALELYKQQHIEVVKEKFKDAIVEGAMIDLNLYAINKIIEAIYLEVHNEGCNTNQQSK